MNAPQKTIVITGAHSPLGQRFLEVLTKDTRYKAVALITPWATLPASLQTIPSLKVFKADLTQPLNNEISEVLSGADAVFHFAWVRGGKDPQSIATANDAMVRNVLNRIKDPTKFYFLSTVAASPGALSIYGQTKFKASEIVRAAGGTVLVLGLVTDKVPTGAYKSLVKLVRMLPFSFRTKGNDVYVYHITGAALNHGLMLLLEKPLPANIYNVFGHKDSLNSFLQPLEMHYPRFRMHVGFQAHRIVKVASLLRSSGIFPKRFTDKIFTFLTKEDEYLGKLPFLPHQ